MATIDIIALALAIAVLVFYNKNCNAALSDSWIERNKSKVIGHAFFAVLLVFAIVYAKERVLLIDSAAQVFEIANKGKFAIYDHRFSMVLSQLLPLLTVKLKMPLVVVLYAYSISFVLLYYLAYLFVQYVVKDDRGIVLMTFGFLCVTHTFFHTISETMQVMFIAVALYSLISHNPGESVLKKVLYYLAFIVLIAFCVFIHPISLFILTFIFLFRIVDAKKIDVKIVVCIVAFAVLYLINYNLIKNNKFVLTSDSMIDLLPHMFESNFYEYFSQYFWNYYYIPTFITVIVTVFYIFKKEYIKALFVLGYILSFFAITLVTYFKPDYNFAIERAFLPLMFLTGVPLIYDILPRVGKRYNTAFVVFVVVLLFGRFDDIKTAGKFYSQRLNSIERITDFANNIDCQKLIIRRTVAKELFFPIWGESIESMILSSVKYGPEHTVSLFVEDDDYKKDLSLLEDNNFLYVNWFKVNWYDWLNKIYFRFRRQPFMEVVNENGNIGLVDVEKTTYDKEIAAKRLELFDEVQEALKERGVNFIVVTAPEKEKLYSDVRDVVADLAQPLAEYGIPYINMTDISNNGDWNLLCENGVDSVFRCIKNICNGSDNTKALFVGGDFIWKLRDDIAFDGRFEDYELWYYNDKAFFGKSREHSTPVNHKNRLKELLMSDCVVFFCDGKQLCDTKYWFLENVLNDLKASDVDKLNGYNKESAYIDGDTEFEKVFGEKIQSLRNNEDYMKMVPVKAKKRGKTVDEIITIDAVWLVENQPVSYR